MLRQISLRESGLYRNRAEALTARVFATHSEETDHQFDCYMRKMSRLKIKSLDKGEKRKESLLLKTTTKK